MVSAYGLNSRSYLTFEVALAAIPRNVDEVNASSSSLIFEETNLSKFFETLKRTTIKVLDLQKNQLNFRLFLNINNSLLREAFNNLPPLEELDVSQNGFDTPIQKARFVALIPDLISKVSFNHPTEPYEYLSLTEDSLRFARSVGKLANIYIDELEKIPHLSINEKKAIKTEFSAHINENYNETSQLARIIYDCVRNQENKLTPNYDPALFVASPSPLITEIENILKEEFNYPNLKNSASIQR